MPLPKRRSSRSSSPRGTSIGEDPRAAPHEGGGDDQVALVDQPGLEGLSGESGTTDRDVSLRRGLHGRHGVGVEPTLIRVRALDADTKVVEYTTLSAASQIDAKSWM